MALCAPYTQGVNAPRVDLIVIAGPTAAGKTRLAVELARRVGSTVISADSRQVYRGLDIGSGKDLDEYEVGGDKVPYRLIDIADLDTEYSVFHFQRDFFEIFEELRVEGGVPVLVGGTGLYIEAALSPKRMMAVPENEELRGELAMLPDEALEARLKSLKRNLHNVTDSVDRDRCVRAIEIAEYERSHKAEDAPNITPLVLRVEWPRAILHERIARRLGERLDTGLIEEVQGLLDRGIDEDRLLNLGLEYRFVTDFLRGRIRNRNDLRQKLTVAINNFAKRQETFLRRLERRGLAMHTVPEAELDAALAVVGEHADVKIAP